MDKDNEIIEEIESLVDKGSETEDSIEQLATVASKLKGALEVKTYQEIRKLEPLFKLLASNIENQSEAYQKEFSKFASEVVQAIDSQPEVQRVLVENPTIVPPTMTIANIKDFPQPYKEVSVDRPEWLDELLTDEVSEVKALLKQIRTGGIPTSIKNLDPNNPIAVRLSDGKQFYKAVMAAISGSGGGASFMTPNGKAAWGLLDDNNHLQVDVLSGGGAGVQYTEGATDATITGTAMLAEAPSDKLEALQVDASKHLQVDIAADSVGIGGGTQYATNVAYGDGNIGTLALAVRDDSLSALTEADGDYSVLRVSSTGALHVTGGGGGIEYTEDVATPAAIAGSAGMMERDDIIATLTPAAGDWAAFRCSAEGALWVQDFNSDTIVTHLSEIESAVETIESAIYAEDVGHSTGDKGAFILGVENEDQADLSTGDKDYTPIAVTKEGNVIVKQEGTITVTESSPLSGFATSAKQLADDHNVTVSNPISGFATSAGQLADGHAVTIDNISSNEVYVRGSGAAGTADAGVLSVQGIASMTPLAVTESAPLSGFATSAKQLADGHNVALSATDNAVLDNIALYTAGSETALELIDNAVDGNYLNVNVNAAGTDLTMNAGVLTAQTQRVTLATDGEVNNLLGTINTDTSSMSADLGTIDTDTGNISTYTAGAEAALEKIDGAIIGPGEPTIDSYTHLAINLGVVTDSVLVASAADKQIWVYGITYTCSVAGTVSFQDEDNTAITGVMDHAANSGLSHPTSGNFAMPIWKLATNKDLEVDTVTCSIDGWLDYAIVSV